MKPPLHHIFAGVRERGAVPGVRRILLSLFVLVAGAAFLVVAA